MSTIQSSVVHVRCRNSKCSNREETVDAFIKCQKCLAARYCSQTCLETDRPLHELMCKSDRVLLDTKGNVTSLEQGLADMAIEVAQMNKATSTNTEGPESVSAPTQQQPQEPVAEKIPEKVFLGPEHSDNEVMRQTINRLQVQTNLFYVDQLEKLMIQLGKKKTASKTLAGKKKATVTAAAKKVAGKKATPTTKTQSKSTPQSSPSQSTPDTTSATAPVTDSVASPAQTQSTSEIGPVQTAISPEPQAITIQKPNVCLFIQTENSVAEYRHVITDHTSPKLNRALVCYFMSETELLTEVVPNHPHPGFKAKNFKAQFQKLVKETNPMEAVVTVALFGADKIFLGASELPPYESMTAQLDENNQFKNSDCLELYIDQ